MSDSGWWTIRGRTWSESSSKTTETMVLEMAAGKILGENKRCSNEIT